MTIDYLNSVAEIITAISLEGFFLQAFFPALLIGIAIKKFKNLDN